MALRSISEIKEALSEARIAQFNGTKFPGMSYEEGVAYALEFVLGEIDLEELIEK